VSPNGFFSFEAAASFFIFLCIILLLIPQSNDFSDVLLHQKTGDLLIVWAVEKSAVEEMFSDANYFFGNNYYLSLDDRIYGNYFSGGFSKEISVCCGPYKKIKLFVKN